MLREEELCIVCHREHPLLQKEHLLLKDFAEENFLLPGKEQWNEGGDRQCISSAQIFGNTALGEYQHSGAFAGSGERNRDYHYSTAVSENGTYGGTSRSFEIVRRLFQKTISCDPS